MLGKLCVCGHEMKPQGKQTLEMNGSSLGSNLWTDHVEVDMYICSWCGRMAFFEPEEARALRFRRACENKTIDQLRAIVDGEQPELLKKAAGEELEAKESLARWKEQKRREEEERRGERKRCSPSFSARTRTTISRRRTARRSFDEFIVKCALCAHFPLDKRPRRVYTPIIKMAWTGKKPRFTAQRGTQMLRASCGGNRQYHP